MQHFIAPGKRPRRAHLLLSTLVAAACIAVTAASGQAPGASRRRAAEPVAAPAERQETVSVAIPVGSYGIVSTARGQEVSIADFGSLLVPGKPTLPSKIFAVAIPPART